MLMACILALFWLALYSIACEPREVDLEKGRVDMDPEDVQPKRVVDGVAALARDDLSLLSVVELQARITSLQAEIVRI